MTIETLSKPASTENRLAARQWVDAFNARDERWSIGKAAEHWFQMDTLTLLKQLGLRVVPRPHPDWRA